MINEKDLIQLIDELSLTDKILPSDIPDLNLYMEQVISFIDEKLGNSKRTPEDKILTKTMINNYTKHGILMPPNNKKYSKQHVILMIFVYYLKQILSLDDIKSLFGPILNDMATIEDDVISIDDIYSVFVDLKENKFKNFEDELSKKLNMINEKTDSLESENRDVAQLFLIVVMLIAQANAQKRLAEKIIDSYFKK